MKKNNAGPKKESLVPKFTERFNQYLNEYLQIPNNSLTTLSEDSKIPDTTLGKWKRGGSPRADYLVKLCDFADKSADYFLGRSKKQIPDPQRIKNFLLEIIEIHKGTDKVFLDLIKELNNVDCCGENIDEKKG